MKKFLCVMLTILLLLGASGCGEEVPQGPVTYAKPTFTPGTMELEQLAAEPGNFDRISDTGNGDYLEIETGYYVNWAGYLYYAENTDLDTWYFVCNDPDCSHGYGCSSFIESNSVWYSDRRIYFTTDPSQYIPTADDEGSIMALLGMELNGNNVTLIHSPEVSSSGVMSGYFETVPGGYLFGGQFLRPDGKYDRLVFVYALEAGRKVLLQETGDDQLADCRTICAQHALDLNGDLSVISSFFPENSNYENTLCWFQDGESMFTDISQIPVWGGYLQDNIIRCFEPGKGYYDVDLLTGERTKLADAQLENSKARILQPNSIIETTLLNPEAAVEKQEMRLRIHAKQNHSEEK